MPTRQTDRHLTANANIRKRTIVLGNFLGGLAWGFGTVIGASFVIAIIAWILKIFGVFTSFSDFFPQIYK